MKIDMLFLYSIAIDKIICRLEENAMTSWKVAFFVDGKTLSNLDDNFSYKVFEALNNFIATQKILNSDVTSIDVNKSIEALRNATNNPK